MKDELFIENILKKGQAAKDKVLRELSPISVEQLNWKPSTGSWSIAECLDHLLISDSSYFAVLKEITEGNYKMTRWEKFSPLTTLWGNTLKHQLQENVRRKMTAPKKLTPKTSNKSLDFIRTHLENLDLFLSYISKCKEIDIDKTIITSPTIRIATYSLRDAFQFLIQHEHRHINQAIRVKENTAFPKK